MNIQLIDIDYSIEKINSILEDKLIDKLTEIVKATKRFPTHIIVQVDMGVCFLFKEISSVVTIDIEHCGAIYMRQRNLLYIKS